MGMSKVPSHPSVCDAIVEAVLERLVGESYGDPYGTQPSRLRIPGNLDAPNGRDVNWHLQDDTDDWIGDLVDLPAAVDDDQRSQHTPDIEATRSDQGSIGRINFR